LGQKNMTSSTSRRGYFLVIKSLIQFERNTEEEKGEEKGEEEEAEERERNVERPRRPPSSVDQAPDETRNPKVHSFRSFAELEKVRAIDSERCVGRGATSGEDIHSLRDLDRE
jgi:hypothetical protein